MTFGPLPLNTVSGAFLFGFPALVSIVNPVGSALVFYNATVGHTHAERTEVARQVAAYALLLLVGSIWIGSYLLNFFGVSLGALRVAGGLVVAVSAWRLLMAPERLRTPREAPQAGPESLSSKAFFPLTLPLTTGPGSISVAVALASARPAHDGGTLAFFTGLTLSAVAIVAVVYLLYAEADRVLRIVGENGASVFNRLAAFLLLCIGVQIMTAGAEALIGPWLIHTAHQV